MGKVIYCENYLGEEFTHDEHRAFITNPDNEYNCEHCPENRNMDCHYCNGNHPCGQPHCWVSVHI